MDFENGAVISFTNNASTLQWLLDFHWLLTSTSHNCLYPLFSLLYFSGLKQPAKLSIFARKTRHSARQSNSNIALSSWSGFHNYLLTEREVVTGKSQTEAWPNWPYWPNNSEVNTARPRFEISRNNRTFEVNKLFIIWLKTGFFMRKSSLYMH